MAYVRLAAAAAVGGASTATTAAIATAGANLIVIGVSWYNGGASDEVTIADNHSNIWSVAIAQEHANGYSARLYYCFNPTTHASDHTFTVTYVSNDTYASIAAAAYSGSVTSPLGQTRGDANTGGATSLATGAITPAEANALVLALWCTDPGTSHSANGGFATLAQINRVGGTNMSLLLSELIQTTAVAANPTGSWTGSSAAVAVIASFKAAVAGAVGWGALLSNNRNSLVA